MCAGPDPSPNVGFRFQGLRMALLSCARGPHLSLPPRRRLPRDVTLAGMGRGLNCAWAGLLRGARACFFPDEWSPREMAGLRSNPAQVWNLLFCLLLFLPAIAPTPRTSFPANHNERFSCLVLACLSFSKEHYFNTILHFP